MNEATNPMARAWLDAASDLHIRVQHPFTFTSDDGTAVTTQGVYLPDFGSKLGTILTCRFDSDDVYDAVDNTDYFQSSLNPFHYEPYNRETMIEALNDWGWFGPSDSAPSWFAGAIGKHGGRGNSQN